ncbi:hypothetical protein POVWA2_056540 [Plasmodium ovale wallikeri]|uniref:Uncharacterized protein n=1 Tax=Plasmodium ovale wallikeri TaxID=864142 RepID=A0A1A8ZXY7_PLAOA|nr:hypothetical protein POVWA1_057150 [Plasmodium ovale wallikeri]SBT48699.1 hypothetical protein POVWA2_056540 [Plasmodium ovale wallikeri]
MNSKCFPLSLPECDTERVLTCNSHPCLFNFAHLPFPLAPAYFECAFAGNNTHATSKNRLPVFCLFCPFYVSCPFCALRSPIKWPLGLYQSTDRSAYWFVFQHVGVHIDNSLILYGMYK